MCLFPVDSDAYALYVASALGNEWRYWRGKYDRIKNTK